MFQQARLLESHLRDNFIYELGAPELNRRDVLEDFLFVQKRGHCERFASALAILLRIQGIPTRVVGGYAPGGRNFLSGGYDIRFSDAHAWTEAWFETRGWVQFDATPRATTQPPDGDGIGDFFEAIDFVWYANVVNLDAPTQNEILANVGVYAGRAAKTMGDHWMPLLVCIASGAGMAWIWRRFPRTKSRKNSPASRTELLRVEMRHSYDEMIAALEKRGLRRSQAQTPLEYLRDMDLARCECKDEIALLTNAFCKARYGETVLEETELEGSRKAMARIRDWSRRS